MEFPFSSPFQKRTADLQQGQAVLWLLLIMFAARAAAGLPLMIANQPFGFDLLPLWTAAGIAFRHPEQLYHFDVITHLQVWAIGSHTGPRPWIYPPSALLVFAPFGSVPFRYFYPLWAAATGVLFAWSTMVHLRRDRWLSLAVLTLSSAVFMALLVGQVTLLIGALVLWGVRLLGRRPVLAGVLLGAAAMIKPTSLLLLPVALLSIRNWRAAAACILTGATAMVMSSVLFGWQTWLDWLHALPAFTGVIQDDPTLWRGVINFTWLAHQAGLPAPVVLFVRILLAGIGVALVWKVFRATERTAPRVIAMVGSSLLITPYAMFYDAALLAAPAMILMSTDERRVGRGMACFALAELAACPPASPLGLVGLIVLVSALTLRSPKQESVLAATA